MRIDKAYFTLAEVLERWRMPLVDLAYLAENAKLRVSVRAFGVPIEFGDFDETPEGQRFRVPSRIVRYNGLLDLQPCDAFRMFRDQEVMVSEFKVPGSGYARVAGDSDPVPFRIGDLLMRREERDRFEGATGFQAGGLSASQDYRRVCFGGKVYYFGPIQAKVIRALHAAAMNGDPWCSGKALLAASGAKSRKMADVFKSKPDYCDVIESNGRGHYRLALRRAPADKKRAEMAVLTGHGCDRVNA
jgi:hypothetical protein